jgi:hypothetical protein
MPVQLFLISSTVQCGHPTCPEISDFQSVSVIHGGKKEHVVKASAGVTFSIVLTESGKGHSLCPFHLLQNISLTFFISLLIWEWREGPAWKWHNGRANNYRK